MMGRSKKPESEKRKNVLRIRLTNNERRKLDVTAEARGKETSTWARDELLSLAGKRRS